MIITSLSQVQSYVNVTASFSVSKLNAHEATAFANFINKYFSTKFCETILEATETTPEITSAKFNIIGAVVCFSMLEWSKTGELIIGDLGILRTENENSKAAYSGQIKKLEASYREKGEIYISELIRVITGTPASFTGYDLQYAFLNQSELIIKSAIEFHQISRMARPYLLFPTLSPCQIIAIDQYLVMSLTQAIVFEFINGIPDDEAKATKESALRLTKFALANFTIATAFGQSLVLLTPNGLVESTSTKDTDQENYIPGNADKIHKQISNYISTGNLYLGKAENLLITAGIIPAPDSTPSKTFIA